MALCAVVLLSIFICFSVSRCRHIRIPKSEDGDEEENDKNKTSVKPPEVTFALNAETDTEGLESNREVSDIK